LGSDLIPAYPIFEEKFVMQTKLIATAVGAFGLGALVGWAVTADIHKRRFRALEKEFDEAIGEKTRHIWALQDYAERTWSASSKTVTNDVTYDPIQASTDQLEFNDVTVGPTQDEEVVETSEVLNENDEVPEGETPEETRTNLQKLIDAYTANQDAKDDFVDVAAESVNDKTPPFVISRFVYAYDEEGTSYEKITLTYFPDDRVLLDDEEDPIEDVGNTVGWRNLSQFGNESEDPNVVFVRNRRLETDFEVIKEDDAQLPLHVKYGMEKEEFRVNKAAGLIKLRQEDDDN
jgi:hypothetical protein